MFALPPAYRDLFRIPAFRWFWFGFTFSVLGDAMTRVALTWYVYQITHSAHALGVLAVTYTGPVVVGGLAAGVLLDRFDRRKVMLVDNLIRGAVMLLIPLLYGMGRLELWHIYLASGVYGLLFMVSLAGGPALIPQLVEKDHLVTANALETISYTLSGVAGPLIGGFLIPLMGAPNVVLLDALSYFFFAAALLRIRLAPGKTSSLARSGVTGGHGLSEAVYLLLKNKILLSTTLMYMAANFGVGMTFVWLPILADRVLNGGSGLYGILLGAMAVGEVISSIMVGGVALRLTLGRLICLAQFLAGLSLSLMAAKLTIPLTITGLALFGFFSAPLTIWAQTLRMQIIPEGLRGRTFALLRTLMQAAGPLGGAAGGFFLPLATISIMVAVSALIVGLPGLVGYGVKDLRLAGEAFPEK